MDTAPDEAFDRFAGLVRTRLGVPVALVSLVDDVRQFFPAHPACPPRWVRDSMAVSDLQAVGYAGMPLTDDRGLVLGALCAIDD